MSVCVGKIRLQGLVEIGEDGKWAVDPESPLYFLIRERQFALPLYPQFGTEPNGFYIPPRWVPRGYLYQMFGPGVDQAIEQYSCPDRELLAVLQLFRAQRQILFKFKIEKGPKVAEVAVQLPNGQEKVQELFNDTVIASKVRQGGRPRDDRRAGNGAAEGKRASGITLFAAIPRAAKRSCLSTTRRRSRAALP